MAGGTIFGSIAAGRARKKAAEEAAKRSPEEQAQYNKQQGLQDQATRQGQQTYAAGMGPLKSTIDYYRTLLDGSRAARMDAVSGEAQDTSQAFAGADAAADRNLRGGERDQAKAENSRAKAGQISRLVTGVRPGAAGALSGIGQQLVNTSEGFSGQAANIGGNLLGNSTQNRQQANAAGERAGASAGAAIGQITGLVANGFSNAMQPGRNSGITGGKTSTGSDIGSLTGRLPGAPLGPEVSY